MVSSSMSPRGHVVALTIPAWGHAKATSALLTKVVRFRSVNATLFAPMCLYDQVRKEIDKKFLHGSEDDLKGLIRVVGIESEWHPVNLSQLTSNFLDGYRKLCASEPLKATPTGDFSFSPVPPPQLVIMDFFVYDALQGVRQESGSAVPVYALESTSASAVLFMLGPENLGGNGDLSKKLEAITETEEEMVAAEADRIYRRVKGELLTIPGLPPMYDHEFSPQEPFKILPLAATNARAHRFLVESDGIIMNSTPVLEKEALQAAEGWLVDKPIICPGPFDYPLISKPKCDSSPTKSEVENFLNTALEKHGPRSVIYISFGSAWWIKQPEKICAALDILMEKGIPFIFARASPYAIIPDETERRIKESGLGYTSNEWLPQTFILQHEACGWFITHCGHNSLTEAITAGVPLICWPIDIDHPVNAALICDALKIGFELFEIRSWHGLKPVHRLGNRSPEGTLEAFRREFEDVLSKATGEDGESKRANLIALREKIARSWEDDGEAWSEIKRIVDVLH